MLEVNNFFHGTRIVEGYGVLNETGNEVKVEIIDLNRIRFMEIGMEMGCKNFERLPGTPEMFAILADE